MDEQPGLDEWAQRVYLVWLARSLWHARVALAEVQERLDRKPPDPLLWTVLETFLTYAGKASRMLKPVLAEKPPNKPEKRAIFDFRKQRGQHLCRLLGVDASSHLLSRDVRNASEHFDEHLDDWMARAPRPTVEQMEAGEWPTQPAPPLMHADPSAGTVVVDGRSLDLAAVGAEVDQLLDRIMAIEPLAGADHPEVATLLVALPPFPPELRLGAPSRRPDESVLTGVDQAKAAAEQKRFEDALSELVKAYRPPGETNT